MYFRCYNNYMIEENDNYKVMFYFLSPNILLLFIFKIASWNVLLFLINSVLCIWLSNEGIKHTFHLSLNYWKLNFFGKQREFTIKIKTLEMSDHSFKNKVFIILVVVVVSTFCWTNISAAMSRAGFHNPLHNQLYSHVLWWCDNKSDFIWFKKQTFILTGCREYLYNLWSSIIFCCTLEIYFPSYLYFCETGSHGWIISCS